MLNQQDQQFNLPKTQQNTLSLDNQFAPDTFLQQDPTTINDQIQINRNDKNIFKVLEAKTEQSQPKVLITERTAVLTQQQNQDVNKKMLNQLQQNDKPVQKRQKTDKNNEQKQLVVQNVQIQARQIERQILNVKILKKKSSQQPKKGVDPKELELRIRQIAKQIRNKVKSKEAKIKKLQEEDNITQKKVKIKELAMIPLRKKQGYIRKQAKPNNSFNQNTPSKLLTFQEVIDAPINPQAIVRQIIKKQIFSKVNKQIDLKEKISKTKLKLDPIKHHYPVTTFRKSILQENKIKQLKQLQIMKQKELKLVKRKDIFNSQRYQRYAKVGGSISKQLKLYHITYTHSKQNDKNINQITMPKINPQLSQSKLVQNKVNDDDAVINVPKKTQVSASVAELDALIQKMGQSNENYVQNDKYSQQEWENQLI